MMVELTLSLLIRAAMQSVWLVTAVAISCKVSRVDPITTDHVVANSFAIFSDELSARRTEAKAREEGWKHITCKLVEIEQSATLFVWPWGDKDRDGQL